MCRVLDVSRSGYYASRDRVRPSARELRDAELIERIRKIHEDSHGTYGSPRVQAQLSRDGIDVSKTRVERLMKAAGLAGRVRRRFRTTTDSSHKQPVAPNVLDREFEQETPDSVWCADISAISTASGWVYLAAVIDLATRLVVGWSTATNMKTALVESALRNALAVREPARQLVHHSDRGSQYASTSYQALLDEHGIICSMSRKGDCWDNAVLESFFGTIKQEWVHHHRWLGLADTTAALHEYIEVFYNRQRLHSSLGYRTPAEADSAA